MATRGVSKLPKITILPRFFPLKFISKCCKFSRDWDRVKGFSALVTRYLMINLWSYLASHMSKIFLTMRGNTAPPPSNHTNTRGHIPLLATAWCILSMGGGAEKVLTFLAKIRKRKHMFGAHIGYFFTIWGLKERGSKVRCFGYIWGKQKMMKNFGITQNLVFQW
jgi:hypothetical protein